MAMSGLVGRTAVPRTVTVARDRVAAFALAVADPRPECRDLGAAHAAGHPDLLAPPTFATTFTFPMPELPGLDWSGAAWVHAEQAYAFGAQVHAGDRITVEVAVEALRERSGAPFDTLLLTLRETGTNQRGEMTHTARMRVLGRRPSSGGGAP